MEQNFNQYLNEMKEKNLYSTDIKSDFLNEEGSIWQTRFDPFKTDKKARPCITVTIDFTAEKFIDNVAEQIKDVSGDEAESQKKITDKISEYILKINKAFKATSGNLFVRGLDNGALKYYFKMYSKTDPEGNANDFKSRIDKDLELSFVKNNMVVKDDTYTRIELVNLKDKPNELNPSKNENDDKVLERLNNSVFVKNIVEKISGTIKSRIEKANNLAKNGELKQVYCVPFKISETLVKTKKEEAKSEDEFWLDLVDEVNNNLKNALKNSGDAINSYIGLVPIKAYGFNIYFTDRDAAEQFAEQFTQESDTKISERKRYEKKIANYVQLLQDEPEEINGKTLEPREVKNIGAKLYFQSTLFAREKIAPTIKDKFDESALIQVNRYTFEITKDVINAIMQGKDDSGKLQLDPVHVYAYIYNNLIRYCEESEEFIGAGSTNDTQIELYFSTKASVEFVKNLISQHLRIEKDNSIKIKQVALTRTEIEKAKEIMKNANTAAENFESFVSELKNNGEHNRLDLEALELTLSEGQRETLIKTRNEANPDRFKGAVKTIIKSISDKFSSINGYVGFIFDDDYKVTIYFENENGINYAKEHYKSDDQFSIGDSKTVTVSNTELNRIKELHLSDGLYKSVDKTVADNKATEEAKEYKYSISYNLVNKDLKIKDFIEAFKKIPDTISESFQSTLFVYLLNKVNINEAESKLDKAKSILANAENQEKTIADFMAEVTLVLRNKIASICSVAKSNFGDDMFNYKVLDNDEQFLIIKCVGKIRSLVETKLLKVLNDTKLVKCKKL